MSFCTAYDNMVKSSDKDLQLMAKVLTDECLTSIVANPKRTVTIVIPSSEFLSGKKKGSYESFKEFLRAHILRRAMNPSQLKDVKSVKSNNGIEFKVSGLSIDGVKLTHVPGAVAKLKSKKGEYAHGEFYKADGAFSSQRSGEGKPEKGGKRKKRRSSYLEDLNMIGGGGDFLQGSALRNAVINSYAIKFAQPLGSYYAYPRWLSSSLTNYLKDAIPSFLHSHRHFYSYSQPMSTIELLLQPRTRSGPYVVSDEILRGFCNSNYFLCDKPSILSKAKILSAFGGAAPYLYSGGAPSPGTLDIPKVGAGYPFVPGVFYRDPLAILKIARTYRDIGSDLASSWRGSPGRLLDGLLDRVYNPLYSNSILSPDALLVHKRVHNDVSLVALHNDLVRLFTGLFVKSPSYDDIMNRYFASDIVSNLKLIKSSLDGQSGQPMGKMITSDDIGHAIAKGTMIFNAIVQNPEDNAWAFISKLSSDMDTYGKDIRMTIPVLN